MRAAANQRALSELGSRKLELFRGGEREWGGESCWVDPPTPPPLPQAEPSTQIEMDFGVICHTESHGEEQDSPGMKVLTGAKLWPL